MHHDAILIATMQHRRAALEQALTRVGWQLTVFHDVKAALEHLRTRPYAAVFCDEYLRGASAGGFLAWSRRIAPKARFYIIAMNDERATLTAVHTPDDVLAFPPDEAALPRPVTASDWSTRASGSSDVPLEGRTDTVGVVELIQMLALTTASGVITLGSGSVGRIYLDQGRLEHVVSLRGGVEINGLHGLAQLLRIEDTDFQVLPYRHPSRRTVHVATAVALTEAARVLDEQRRDAKLLDAIEVATRATGIAVANAPSERPTATRGAGEAAFALAVAALAALKPATGPVSHLALETDQGALAVLRSGDGRLLVATATRGRSLTLLSALVKTVKQSGGP